MSALAALPRLLASLPSTQSRRAIVRERLLAERPRETVLFVEVLLSAAEERAPMLFVVIAQLLRERHPITQAWTALSSDLPHASLLFAREAPDAPRLRGLRPRARLPDPGVAVPLARPMPRWMMPWPSTEPMHENDPFVWMPAEQRAWYDARCEQIARDPRPDVLARHLRDGALREREVVRVAARRPTCDALVDVLLASDRFIERAAVLRALAANPTKPTCVSLALLPLARESDRRALAEAEDAPVTRLARALYRPPLRVSPEEKRAERAYRAWWSREMDKLLDDEIHTLLNADYPPIYREPRFSLKRAIRSFRRMLRTT